jgi:hypothetical protein
MRIKRSSINNGEDTPLMDMHDTAEKEGKKSLDHFSHPFVYVYLIGRLQISWIRIFALVVILGISTVLSLMKGGGSGMTPFFFFALLLALRASPSPSSPFLPSLYLIDY